MKYAAFFRGINVGGKNIVKMAQLKQLFVGLGFKDVETYIQSGNVIFSSDNEKSELTAMISKSFEATFGFQSMLVLRSDEEIAGIIGLRPFNDAEIEQAERETPDVAHLYVYLTDTAIDRKNIEPVFDSYDGNDKIYIAEYEIYLLCRQSIRASKLAALLGRLPQPFTARNLKTIEKIYLLFREKPS